MDVQRMLRLAIYNTNTELVTTAWTKVKTGLAVQQKLLITIGQFLWMPTKVIYQSCPSVSPYRNIVLNAYVKLVFIFTKLDGHLVI